MENDIFFSSCHVNVVPHFFLHGQNNDNFSINLTFLIKKNIKKIPFVFLNVCFLAYSNKIF